MPSDQLANLVSDKLCRFSPDIYDGLYGQFAQYNSSLARICATLTKFEQVDDLVELGCGTGLFSEPIIEAYRPHHFTGIDPTKHMLEKASQRLATLNVALHCDKAQNLSRYFRAGSIDVIAIKSAFHHFNDELSVDDLVNFLSERGKLVLVERTPRSAASYPIFDEWHILVGSSYTFRCNKGGVNQKFSSQTTQPPAGEQLGAVACRRLAFANHEAGAGVRRGA